MNKKVKNLLIGAGIIAGVGACGYSLYSNRRLIGNIKVLQLDNKSLRKDNDTLMSAASEGLFEEAIATVTRKANTAKDRVDVISKQLLSNPNDRDLQKALDNYQTKFNMLTIKKQNFIEAKRTYEIIIED